MPRHLSPRTLQALAAGELDAGRLRRALLHLGGCLACRGRLADASRPAPADPAALAAAVDRAVDEARRRAGTLLAELASGRPGESARRVAAGGLPSEMSLATVRALVELAASLRHESPARTLELSRLATVYARRPDLDRQGAALANDLRALACAEYANALRINDRLAEASAVVADAAVFAGKGTGDMLLEARLRDVAATLHAARREFAAADRLLVQVARAYRRAGDPHLAGRALVSRGLYAGYRNDAEEALRLLREGLALIDPERDPVVLLAAKHGEAWWTAELGRPREARRLLFAVRHLYAADTNEMNRLRLLWLEGKISAGMGDLAQAEEQLEEVCRDFDHLGLPYTKALAALELAVVLLLRGKRGRVRELVGEMVATFERLAIHREALAALLILHDSARADVLSVAALERAAGLLRCFEHLPANGPAAGG